MTKFSDEDKYQEAKREHGLRIGVYGKAEKLHGRNVTNERRIAIMKEIADDYLRKIAPGLDLDEQRKAQDVAEKNAGQPLAPLVLYFARDEDRDEVIAAAKASFPHGVRSVKL